jgi:orotidine-5'-phosphate decarboxylase
LIEATADLVCAYKPQIAHYAALGVEAELCATIQYINTNYPAIPVILDAKRGDIGSTAEKYALEAFARYQADAVTVNPYLGGDSLVPFLAYAEKGVVILCRTSNPGGGDLQGLEIDGEALYLKLARLAATSWNKNRNILLVVGATWPDELARVREVVGDIPLLVPGIGAQGGDLEAVLKAGLDPQRRGLIINSSRGIIYAGSGDNFAGAARQAAQELRDAINCYR